MATSDFNFPVTGVSGTAFRNNMQTAFTALLTNNSDSNDPPVIFPFMTQVYTGGATPELRFRNGSSWVTLLPDLTQQYGGLDAVLGGSNSGGFDPAANISFSGNNTFSGTSSFSGNTTVPTAAQSDTTGGKAASLDFVRTAVSNGSGSGGGIFTKSFQASVNFAPDNIVNIAHTLGEVPKLITVSLVITNGVANYGAGTVIALDASIVALDRSTSGVFRNDSGVTVTRDSNNIELVFGQSIPVISRQTFDVALISSNFDVRVNAYA